MKFRDVGSGSSPAVAPLQEQPFNVPPRPTPCPAATIAEHQATAAVSTDAEVDRLGVQCIAPPRGGTYCAVTASTLVDDATASSTGKAILLILKYFLVDPSFPLYCQLASAVQRENGAFACWLSWLIPTFLPSC